MTSTGSYTNKSGETIHTFTGGWKIGEKKMAENKRKMQEAQSYRQCPRSLIAELESAIKDNEPQWYIDGLKERIARYN